MRIKLCAKPGVKGIPPWPSIKVWQNAVEFVVSRKNLIWSVSNWQQVSCILKSQNCKLMRYVVRLLESLILNHFLCQMVEYVTSIYISVNELCAGLLLKTIQKLTSFKQTRTKIIEKYWSIKILFFRIQKRSKWFLQDVQDGMMGQELYTIEYNVWSYCQYIEQSILLS